MKICIQIPQSFLIAPFFQKGEREIIYDAEQDISNILAQAYFIYDIADGSAEAYKPWLDVDYAIPIIFELWKQNKGRIATLFKERKKEDTREGMVLFTAHFLSILHWLNGQRVQSLQNISDAISSLSIKPINAAERINFILEAPNHYHSFIQISELYEEIEKQFFKQIALKKLRGKIVRG